MFLPHNPPKKKSKLHNFYRKSAFEAWLRFKASRKAILFFFLIWVMKAAINVCLTKRIFLFYSPSHHDEIHLSMLCGKWQHSPFFKQSGFFSDYAICIETSNFFMRKSLTGVSEVFSLYKRQNVSEDEETNEFEIQPCWPLHCSGWLGCSKEHKWVFKQQNSDDILSCRNNDWNKLLQTCLSPKFSIHCISRSICQFSIAFGLYP